MIGFLVALLLMFGIEPESDPETRRFLVNLEASQPTLDRWLWEALAACESSGRWAINARHDGGLQFNPDTWRRAVDLVGLTGVLPDRAYEATPDEQIWVAREWLAETSWRQWPRCARRLGLR